MSDTTEAIKVPVSTHEKIRLAAATSDMTMGAVVDVAVREFIESHRSEIEAGFEHARKVLTP